MRIEVQNSDGRPSDVLIVQQVLEVMERAVDPIHAVLTHGVDNCHGAIRRSEDAMPV